MSLIQEDLPPFPTEDVFEYGDHTILQLRSQPFAVQDDFGTIVTMPLETTPFRTVAAPLADLGAQEEPDRIARLEEKLDAALRQIAALQQRLESIDQTLMRTLVR